MFFAVQTLEDQKDATLKVKKDKVKKSAKESTGKTEVVKIVKAKTKIKRSSGSLKKKHLDIANLESSSTVCTGGDSAWD